MRRCNRSAHASLVCAVTLLVGCAGDSIPPVASTPIDTVNGIPVVRNGPTPLWDEGEAWSMVETHRLGGVDVPEAEMFGGLLGVGLGPTGRLFVMDAMSSDVRVFAPDGAFIRTLGGPGEGPGELSSPVSMGWDGQDRLWVSNAFDGRYTVFDSAGAFVKTVQTTRGRAISRFVFPMWFDGRGTFLDHTVRDRTTWFIRRDTAGLSVDTAAALPWPDRGPVPEGVVFVTLPQEAKTALGSFLPRQLWALGPDGSIWEAESDELRLVQRSPAGDTLRIIETSHRARAFTPEEQAVVDAARRDLDSAIDLKPRILTALFVLPDGHVLAHLNGELSTPSDSVDVFDPEGRWLGSMAMPGALDLGGLAAARGDAIAGAARGKLDTSVVIRATIRRPG